MSKGERWEQPTGAAAGGRAGSEVAVPSFVCSINIRPGPILHIQCARYWNSEILRKGEGMPELVWRTQKGAQGRRHL